MAKKRIAILGGGMSSLVTAYQLTLLPDFDQNFEITLYQQGWRLGGKGASGKNAAEHGRIEEHGLHLLFGFYDNAFRILRDCYAREQGEVDAWRQAFTAVPGPVCMPTSDSGPMTTWDLACPQNSMTPGDDKDLSQSPWGYAVNLLAWLRSSLGGTRAVHGLDAMRGDLPAIEDFAERLHKQRSVVPPDTYREVAWLLADAMPHDPEAHSARDYELIDYLADSYVSRERALFPSSKNTILADFGYAVVKGLIGELVIKRRGWFDLDSDDLRAWLKHHGASDETCQSPVVGGLYDAVFAGGHTLGAGTVLQAMLRALFTFKGAFIYRMEGGMGDIVFAPLYRLLRDRVEFRFFHRVDEVRLSSDGARVAEVLMTRQVELRGDDYRPLVDDRHWPSAPLWEQLQGDPDTLRTHDLESCWDDLPGQPFSLDASEFDVLVLGISVGALADICKDMMFDSRRPRFQWMVRALGTVQTQAAQLWLDAESPGWPGSVVIPFSEPFDTAADMSHILKYESWGGTARSLAYACSPLLDEEIAPPSGPNPYPRRQLARVQANLDDWMKRCTPRLWPQAGGLGLDTNSVVSSYVNAPSNLSDRYVLSTQNSNRYRLRANESGYENLILTGDWIKTALSVGCLEAATMAGIQSARAIDARVPKATGDWLPDAPPPQARTRDDAPPTYVYRDGDVVSKPPITLDLLVYTYVLAADYRQLTRLCNSQLNLGATEYRPLGPFVILYCSQLNNIAEPFGSASELDFGFWIPVARGKSRDGGFDVESILTFSPYVWVDNGLALVGGRTVYGFPKQLGTTMSMPVDDDAPSQIALECDVLPTWTTQAKRAPMLNIVRDPAGPRGPLTSTFSGWMGFLAGIEPLFATMLGGKYPLPSFAVAKQFIERPGNPMVFLKQFPDATEEQGACYRAVVEAPVDFTPDQIKGGPLSGKFTITIYDYASHHITSTLGLTGTSAGATTTITPLGAGWGQFKSIIGAAKVVP